MIGREHQLVVRVGDERDDVEPRAYEWSVADCRHLENLTPPRFDPQIGGRGEPWGPVPREGNRLRYVLRDLDRVAPVRLGALDEGVASVTTPASVRGAAGFKDAANFSSRPSCESTVGISSPNA